MENHVVLSLNEYESLKDELKHLEERLALSDEELMERVVKQQLCKIVATDDKHLVECFGADFENAPCYVRFEDLERSIELKFEAREKYYQKTKTSEKLYYIAAVFFVIAAAINIYMSFFR